MKTLLMALLCAVLIAAPLRAAKPAKPASPLPAADGFKNDEERTIYALGYMMGQNIQVFKMSPAELKVLDVGVNAGAAGKTAAIALDSYRPRVQELATRRLAAAAVVRKEAGKSFAEKFAQEPGVKPIPGGGWYKITEEGKGGLATAEDTLKVHYRGTFIDGTEFDSSYKGGSPFPVSLKGGVIKCWIDVLAILKAGAKAKIVCPSDTAYGDAGRGSIKGGETLVFDIEFVKIEKPAKH
ncbi:MAG: FKBP-type peptidyl-prolyl cis-trans isomerase [Elusimicrobiota bacterium]